MKCKMEVDMSWRSQAFRQRIIAQIDDVIRQSGNPINKTSIEMENHVYDRARTKDEYLSYVARLILHAREMNAFNKKNSRQSFGMPSDGIANLDPLNALQSMTQQGTNIQSLGGALTTRNPSDLNSVLPTMQMSQQYPPMSGTATGAFNTVRHSGADLPGLPPPPSSSTMLTPFTSNEQLLVTDVSSSLSPHPPVSVQPFKPSGTRPGSQHSPGQSAHSQFPTSVANYGTGVRTAQSGPTESMLGSPFVSHSPRPGAGGAHSRSTPSPAQFSSASFSSQMAPSPYGYLPSHSPHMVPSPGGPPPPHHAAMQTPRSTPATMPSLSPGSALGTPASVAASPDEQVYMEKVRQLSKYIEPLERIIARIEKDSDKKKELSKMTSLRDILTNHTHKRLPYETLLKCEQVLEKMELHVRASEASANVVASLAPAADLQSKEYSLCQPLFDAVVGNINLPTFSHTLQRTFGPAVAALHGRRSQSPPAKKRKSTEVEEEEAEEIADIPDVVQGEIARLDRRFKINLNPTYHSGSRTIHLVCQLDDKNLPCVPPIEISVPEGYPKRAPKCDAHFCGYDSTDFLQTVHLNLSGRLQKLPVQFSITSLLETWEMSVRQACAPRVAVPSVAK